MDSLAPAKAPFLGDPARLLLLPGIAAIPPSFPVLCKQKNPRFAFNKSDAKICFIIPMETEGTKRGGELQGNSDLQRGSWHFHAEERLEMAVPPHHGQHGCLHPEEAALY